ncbi:hypothetical protein M406DRAFT_358131 [Cryphonectria parasitica EP155]|uniref:Extracellular membrane protein CFEM domain-containing protein n=1 Tax=Cryphonectria parasitica (strain ATCC 38755 / EP155) TaxID=660469 RepID=A0A9P5CK38_CRYP1|nr:uncharacterized protein M406DRAFT_358131 [Cryphonectria parasitica EP155]KAF3761884.1 hypothetical protein M406DRAFT_358131 [Cryphonectria parasitica EP155]
MKSFAPLVVALTAVFAPVVLAHPGHGSVAPLIVPRADNTTDDNNNSTNTVATDHIPIFQAADCVCPAAVCDPRLNAASICACQAQAKLACYMQSNGACPKPADGAC